MRGRRRAPAARRSLEPCVPRQSLGTRKRERRMVATSNGRVGRIVQVIGSTFDAEFAEGELPDIYNAVKIDSDTKGISIRLTGEVQQHLGGSRVRCVALGSTDGLTRGMAVRDTGGPVAVPVGKETLGRVFNLLGEPIDGRGPVQAAETRPIH